jgi:hypothetical protein
MRSTVGRPRPWLGSRCRDAVLSIFFLILTSDISNALVRGQCLSFRDLQSVKNLLTLNDDQHIMLDRIREVAGPLRDYHPPTYVLNPFLVALYPALDANGAPIPDVLEVIVAVKTREAVQTFSRESRTEHLFWQSTPTSSGTRAELQLFGDVQLSIVAKSRNDPFVRGPIEQPVRSVDVGLIPNGREIEATACAGK